MTSKYGSFSPKNFGKFFVVVKSRMATKKNRSFGLPLPCFITTMIRPGTQILSDELEHHLD